MSHDQVLKELFNRRANREATDRQTEAGDWCLDELFDAWRAAQSEATAAYENWCDLEGAEAYCVYRAAQDRADEAQDALWQRRILAQPTQAPRALTA
jgi:hypothetical protein